MLSGVMTLYDAIQEECVELNRQSCFIGNAKKILSRRVSDCTISVGNLEMNNHLL